MLDSHGDGDGIGELRDDDIWCVPHDLGTSQLAKQRLGITFGREATENSGGVEDQLSSRRHGGAE